MEVFDIISKSYIDRIDVNSIKNIYFINFLAHGDILFSKKFVIDIMSKLPNIQYYYIIDNNRKKVLHDVPNLQILYVNHFKYFNSLLYVSNQLTKNLDVSIGYKPYLTPYFIQVLDNNLFINMWIGGFIGNTKPLDLLSTHISYFSKNLYPLLGITMEDSHYYDFSLSNKSINIDTRLLNKDTKYNVLLLDGPCTSGQVENFSLESIGLFLVSQGYTVITSHSSNPKFININSIVNTEDENGNLLEIQRVSTMCRIIIGRNSGLLQSTFVKENNDKVILLFSSSHIWRPNYLNIFTIFCRNKKTEQCINECAFILNMLINYSIE